MSRLLCSSLLAFALSVVLGAMASPPANPSLSAPVTGGTHGQPFGGIAPAAMPAGYVEEERFFSGTATSYAKAGTWGVDGLWEATPGTTAPYKVRMLIRRPKD